MKIEYDKYWSMKSINSSMPQPKVIDLWYKSITTSPLGVLIQQKLCSSKKILDFGAGDKKWKSITPKKSIYKSLDINNESDHDYHSIDQINETFDSILFMDVLEHIELNEGLRLSLNLIDLLDKNGFLLIQTPNGKCIRNHLGSDMTHKQLYNLRDLYSFFKSRGFEVDCYRVNVFANKLSVFAKIKHFISAFIITRIIGADYTDNIFLYVQKSQ